MKIFFNNKITTLPFEYNGRVIDASFRCDFCFKKITNERLLSVEVIDHSNGQGWFSGVIHLKCFKSWKEFCGFNKEKEITDKNGGRVILL